MESTLRVNDAFEIARQIERNGARFYRRAAELFDVTRAKSMLLDLAAMEDVHEKIFSEMEEELAEKSGMEIEQPEESAAAYLKSLADGAVFPITRDPSELLTGEQTLSDVLTIAVGLEKDSIVFYLGIRDVIPEELGRHKISDIIKEEMRHITRLSDILHTIR
jgi:rubrerythrin